MEPLDLTKQPPRSPREKMLDCYFLPRTIDKLRAQLPGGNAGRYFVVAPRSISGYVLHKLKIGEAELRDVVARAKDEDEVAAWLRERIDPATVREINGKISGMRLDQLDADGERLIYENHPEMRGREGLTTTFDLLEADDAQAFARS